MTAEHSVEGADDTDVWDDTRGNMKTIDETGRFRGRKRGPPPAASKQQRLAAHHLSQEVSNTKLDDTSLHTTSPITNKQIHTPLRPEA